MAMLYYDREGPQIRGTLSGIFVFGVIAALISLAIVGRLGRDEVVLAISLLPALIIGYWLSKYSARFLDRGYIRPTILIVSGTAAAITILRYIL